MVVHASFVGVYVNLVMVGHFANAYTLIVVVNLLIHCVALSAGSRMDLIKIHFFNLYHDH